MPAPQPGKIVCVGRNYAAHAKELGNAVPDQPLLFFKPISAVISSGESIVLPQASSRVEFEGEIGIQIGGTLRRASPDEARAAISGVVVANDITARDLQKTDGQWARAKGFDSFCPLGAVVASGWKLDELEVTTRVNGEKRQHGHVKEMIFPIVDLLCHVSSIMTLVPGDILLTGTPEGVGPLRAGDVVEVEIPGVGIISNPVIEDD